MDPTVRYVTGAVRLLRNELRKVRASLHGDVRSLADGIENLRDSEDKHRQADEERRKANVPVTLTNSQLDVTVTKQARPEKSKAEARWGLAKKILEAVGVVAVVIYTFVAYNQWDKMDESNQLAMANYGLARRAANQQLKQSMAQTEILHNQLKATQDEFAADQRPYVWVAKAGKESIAYDPTAQRAKWTYFYSNYGKTPVNEMRIWEFCQIPGEKMTPSFGTKGKAVIDSPLPAGKDDFATIEFPKIMTREEFDAILATDEGFQILVRFSYTDSTGKLKGETSFHGATLASGALQWVGGAKDNYMK